MQLIYAGERVCARFHHKFPSKSSVTRLKNKITWVWILGKEYTCCPRERVMGECLCLNFTSHPASDQPDGETAQGLFVILGHQPRCMRWNCFVDVPTRIQLRKSRIHMCIGRWQIIPALGCRMRVFFYLLLYPFSMLRASSFRASSPVVMAAKGK